MLLKDWPGSGTKNPDPPFLCLIRVQDEKISRLSETDLLTDPPPDPLEIFSKHDVLYINRKPSMSWVRIYLSFRSPMLTARDNRYYVLKFKFAKIKGILTYYIYSDSSRRADYEYENRSSVWASYQKLYALKVI